MSMRISAVVRGTMATGPGSASTRAASMSSEAPIAHGFCKKQTTQIHVLIQSVARNPP
jgi:hypothetical protein